MLYQYDIGPMSDRCWHISPIFRSSPDIGPISVCWLGRQCRFTLIVQHLTVCSYLKPPDTMMILLSLALSVWLPFARLLPISIKCDVTPIKMLFTLKYTFYKKSISKVSKMCLYLMAFRVRQLGIDHRRPTTKFLQCYMSGHMT